MKISKSLLSAIAAGIVMTAATSCAKTEATELRNGHLDDCTENCEEDHRDDSGDDGHTWDCPACGMG